MPSSFQNFPYLAQIKTSQTNAGVVLLMLKPNEGIVVLDTIPGTNTDVEFGQYMAPDLSTLQSYSSGVLLKNGQSPSAV